MATLPSSGPLSLGTIGTFFGDTAPFSMSEYYRGGGKVPNIAANNAIPLIGSGAALSISMYYGAKLMDPVAALTWWWNNRGSLTKSYTNTYLGPNAYTNTAHWGRGATYFPVTHINTPPPDDSGGG